MRHVEIKGIRKLVNNYYTFDCKHCNFKSIILIPKNINLTKTRVINKIPNRTVKHFIPIIPQKINIEAPNDDLNENIKSDYIEASQIYQKSPRGACALLRLCLQNLLTQLKVNSKNINEGIAKLVKIGLNPGIQEALDLVRVIGNNAVHPIGKLDLKDDIETAERLFEILNIIAENQITNVKKIKGMFEEKVPENLKKKIVERDHINHPP